MADERILIVDDDLQIQHLLEQFLRQEGYKPIVAGSAAAALDAIRRYSPDLLLLDIRLPDANGLDLLKEQLLPELGDYRVIVLSGYGTRQDAEAAVMAGAFDYLTKPLALSRLAIAIRNCLRLQHLSTEMEELSGGSLRPVSLRDLVGASAPMQALRDQIKRVAPFDVPVLILGESGTGKELVARAIHAVSARRKGPFVPLDCGALPDTLVEAEVFGYARGAFSGATQGKPGKLESADGGTLLLDEIGNIPLHSQPKLLRVLQTSMVERLGSNQPVSVDVRLLSATNSCLQQRVDEGSFRLDLYHRLNTVTLTVPPLRDRKEDIPLLAHYMLMKANQAYGKSIRGLSAEAMAMLEAYRWPGNVRELENAVRSATILADHLIEPIHLPQQIRTSAGEILEALKPAMKPGESLVQLRRRTSGEAERESILRTLEAAGWNKAEAARRLQVDYKALYLKMKRYGIPPARPG
ncbi:MAG: sigma-54-dependent transcriptional regulator [Nitrospiraceae bacterium]